MSVRSRVRTVPRSRTSATARSLRDGFGPPADKMRSARSRSRLRALMVGRGVDLKGIGKLVVRSFVRPGEGKSLPVSYVGSDPLPDTFVDNSQALIEGRPGTDGRFMAEHVQAKCASKYEATPGGKPAAAPPATQRSAT